MAKTFSWVLLFTFSDLRDYLQKGTSGFFLFTSFLNSQNMKNMSSFTFTRLVKTSNSDELVDFDGVKPFLLRVCYIYSKGFIRRMKL